MNGRVITFVRSSRYTTSGSHVLSCVIYATGTKDGLFGVRDPCPPTLRIMPIRPDVI